MEQLALIDLDLDRVRAEAAEGACPAGSAPSATFAEAAAFSVSAREFVRGAAEPPDEVDREDFERCVGKVIVTLRRGGERLADASLEVRYHVGSGRVVSIVLRRDDDRAATREVYRRIDPALSATG